MACNLRNESMELDDILIFLPFSYSIKLLDRGERANERNWMYTIAYKMHRVIEFIWSVKVRRIVVILCLPKWNFKLLTLCESNVYGVLYIVGCCILFRQLFDCIDSFILNTVLPMCAQYTQQLAVFVSNTPWVTSEQKGTTVTNSVNKMIREIKWGKHYACVGINHFHPSISKT